MAHTYPPVAFPPPPPTSNVLSSHERALLIRSSKKLSKVLGDVPRVLDDVPVLPSGPELTRTTAGASITESAWRKRKPTHLPPILKFVPLESTAAPDSPSTNPVYYRPPACRSSVLSDAPSIVSNAPLNGPFIPDAPSTSNSQRRTKLERLRRKLGDEVPATAVFPTNHTAVPLPSPCPLSPTPKTYTSRSRSRTRSVHHQPDDARSLTFSISSDESVHTVTFTTAHVRTHSPHPSKTQAKNVYRSSALPPVPPIPAYLVSASKSTSTSQRDNVHDDDAGLIRPRQKMGAGSKIGGSDFKAARRAKREGRSLNGAVGVPGEMVEMVGFM